MTEKGLGDMTRKKSGPEDISDKLHEAIDGLRKDVTRVEIWATALATFSQPVPEYRPNAKFELGKAVDIGPMAKNDSAELPANRPKKSSD